MLYLILSLVAVAAGAVAAYLVFRNKDKIVDTVTDAVDDVATGAVNAISHAAKEAAEELDKLKK
jgi:hypothetical protein